MDTFHSNLHVRWRSCHGWSTPPSNRSRLKPLSVFLGTSHVERQRSDERKGGPRGLCEEGQDLSLRWETLSSRIASGCNERRGSSLPPEDRIPFRRFPRKGDPFGSEPEGEFPFDRKVVSDIDPYGMDGLGSTWRPTEKGANLIRW